jgi:hypothetical protein
MQLACTEPTISPLDRKEAQTAQEIVERTAGLEGAQNAGKEGNPTQEDQARVSAPQITSGY